MQDFRLLSGHRHDPREEVNVQPGKSGRDLEVAAALYNLCMGSYS